MVGRGWEIFPLGGQCFSNGICNLGLNKKAVTMVTQLCIGFDFLFFRVSIALWIGHTTWPFGEFNLFMDF